MQTILFVPTSSGIGLTSACLGFIRALDYVGLKAGFLKPFSQNIVLCGWNTLRSLDIQLIGLVGHGLSDVGLCLDPHLGIVDFFNIIQLVVPD